MSSKPGALPPLRALLFASGLDAFGSMFVLTLVAVDVTTSGGLGDAALLANAQMIGYGAGAVATGWLTRRWWLRRVLVVSLLGSLLGRLAVLTAVGGAFPLLGVVAAAGAFEFAKAVSITATQAEVVARRPGGVPLAWSGSILAVGMGIGGAVAGLDLDVSAALVASLTVAPMLLVARGVSREAADRSRRLAHLAVIRRAARPLALGAMVTVLAFGPIVLNVGLTTTVAGASWVAASLLVLHLGAVFGPPMAGRLLRRIGNRPNPALLPLVAAAVWASWMIAPAGPVFLIAAQLVSGLALHTYGALHAELLIASVDAEEVPVVLGLRALTWQISSLAGSALLPFIVHEVGVSTAGMWHVALLAALALLIVFRGKVAAVLPAWARMG